MSRAHKDWRLHRVGTLTVLRMKRTQRKYDDPRWVCRCDCGRIREIPFSRLQRGVRHCGDVARHESVTK